METYRIIDLTVTPNIIVIGKDSVTYEEGVNWIMSSGVKCPICDYTLELNK